MCFFAHSECCARWFITFNGEECIDPAPIDGVVHSQNATSVNIHRSSTITGLCSATGSGALTANTQYSVLLNLENCGTESINAYTGFESVTSMIIEEWPQR